MEKIINIKYQEISGKKTAMISFYAAGIKQAIDMFVGTRFEINKVYFNYDADAIRAISIQDISKLGVK